MLMKLRIQIINLCFTTFCFCQFGNIKVTIDDKLLRSDEKQIVFNLKNDIKHFFSSTEWDDTYNDLSIPLHIQIVFEG